MPITYLVESTDGTLSFTVNQGEKDGYGGTSRTTDLTLNGFGVLSWGENVNEDILRVMECHAVERKGIGDYNPDTDAYDYNPITDPVLPKSELDVGMGPGKGINFPIIGQLWYDKTTEHTYAYREAGSWHLISGSAPSSPIPPASPDTGDMYFNTITDQLMIWDGTMWISVANDYVRLDGVGAMTGPLTLNTNAPSFDLQAASKKYVDDQVSGAAYVEKAGDTMSGILTLSAKPTNPLEAATKSYVDDDAPYVYRTGDTMTGDLLIDDADIQLTTTTDTAFGLGLYTTGLGSPIIRMISGLFLPSTTVTRPPHIEMYNNENAGTTGSHGWVRLVPRDGEILTIEADKDPEDNTIGPNKREVTSWRQDGVLEHNGMSGGLNVVFCPDQTIADTNAHSRILTTKEYVDSVAAGAGTFTSFGPYLLTTSNIGWTTYDAQSIGMPAGVTSVQITVNGGRGEGAEAATWVKPVSGASHKCHTATVYVGGGHDGGQTNTSNTIVAVNGNGQFQILTTAYSTVRVEATGYFQ